MHTTEAEILALLHGELASSEADRIRQHCADCQECAARHDVLCLDESVRHRLLNLLDAPLPAVTVGTIRRRAIARRRGAGVAAAIVMLITAASAAVAFPGSPLRSWIVGSASPVAIEREPASQPATVPPATDGVQVLGLGTMIVELRYPQRTGLIRISHTDSPFTTARAIGGSVGFRVGSGRITLDNRDPAAVYEIDLPRNLIQAAVRVGGRVLVRVPARVGAPFPDTLTIDLSRHSGATP